ncbi:DUF5316 domain-containing protein [Siminovitchia sp. FSL H7-0308]|uniref:Amino acid transporter n=1 Tax=Siminovitchia thermophila TaxID=1245522 RepID=A0ABS2R3S9_9BACI|nr:DUF5316 domain-containing protein [Siminovitchia thermophila]MBM7713548.1 amino acid transporter [Siminovitchia thermophila]
MKYVIIGILLSFVAVLFSLAVWGMEKVVLITGGIGVLFLGLAALMSGALVSGDRMRANYTSESSGERNERTTVSTRLALISFPNLVVAVCFLYFM